MLSQIVLEHIALVHGYSIFGRYLSVGLGYLTLGLRYLSVGLEYLSLGLGYLSQRLWRLVYAYIYCGVFVCAVFHDIYIVVLLDVLICI
jgi:hypothetical protein